MWLKPREARRVRVRVQGALRESGRTWTFLPGGDELARLPSILVPGATFECAPEEEERESEDGRDITGDRILMVQVLNVGDSSVQLLSGTCLGLAHPHAEVGVFNPMGIGMELEKDELDEYEDELQGGREPDTELPNVEKLREKVGGLAHLTEKQREQVLELLIEHQDIFAINPNAPPSANVQPHAIREVAGSRPVYAHGYRMNPKKSAELERQVKEKVEAGLVVPVRSAYASPVVLVKKPDGSFRFTCDYRKLNAQTIPDRHPLPRIDDLLAQLGGNQFFTCLDLSSGFFQIPLDKDSVLKTAFQTPGGLYAWKRMPQGLTNAPAAFQRAMAA